MLCLRRMVETLHSVLIHLGGIKRFPTLLKLPLNVFTTTETHLLLYQELSDIVLFGLI